MKKSTRALFLLCFILPAGFSFAQSEEAWAQEQEPLETQITGGRWANRLRLESSVTTARDALLREDPAYLQTPSQLYALDYRVITKDKLKVGASMEKWRSKQGFDLRRYETFVTAPIWGGWSSRMKYSRQEQDGNPARNYAYLSAFGMLNNSVYSSSEYQYMNVSNSKDTHQLYQYLSWSAHPRVRVGTSGYIQYDGVQWDIWNVSGLATLEPVLDWTTIRGDVRTGGGDQISDYAEVRCMVYQRLWDNLVLRPDVRYYRDEDDQDSIAYGVKLIAYLSPALDVQCGYRYYSQSEGSDFNTMTLGLGLLF